MKKTSKDGVVRGTTNKTGAELIAIMDGITAKRKEEPLVLWIKKPVMAEIKKGAKRTGLALETYASAVFDAFSHAKTR